MNDDNKIKSMSNSDVLLYLVLFPLGAALLTNVFETGIWFFFVAWIALCVVYGYAKKEDKKDMEQDN